MDRGRRPIRTKGGVLMNDPLAYLIVALVTLFVFQMIEISGKEL